MFGFSTVKLIGAAIAAAAVLSFVLLALHWKSTMTSRGAELATICAATRTAADNPKMDCKLIPQEVALLGQSMATLKAGVADQNAKIAAFGQQTTQEQADSAKASQMAQERAGKAQATSTRLDASSRAGGAPCEPSKALKGSWR